MPPVAVIKGKAFQSQPRRGVLAVRPPPNHSPSLSPDGRICEMGTVIPARPQFSWALREIQRICERESSLETLAEAGTLLGGAGMSLRGMPALLSITVHH